MQYSEIKTLFTGMLNRRDITPSQIQTFLSLGIQYVLRRLRVPPQENSLIWTADGTRNIPIPGDYLEMIQLFTEDQAGCHRAVRTDLVTAADASRTIGPPRYYHRVGPNFILGPYPPAGSQVFIQYYADATALSNDADRNWLTDACPAACVYAGLKYACDFFLDERKGVFEATLETELMLIEEQAQRDELTNASIMPMYQT